MHSPSKAWLGRSAQPGLRVSSSQRQRSPASIGWARRWACKRRRSRFRLTDRLCTLLLTTTPQRQGLAGQVRCAAGSKEGRASRIRSTRNGPWMRRPFWYTRSKTRCPLSRWRWGRAKDLRRRDGRGRGGGGSGSRDGRCGCACAPENQTPACAYGLFLPGCAWSWLSARCARRVGNGRWSQPIRRGWRVRRGLNQLDGGSIWISQLPR